MKHRDKLIHEIAKTQEVIRRKYKTLKGHTVENQIKFANTFKPLIEPLHEIANLSKFRNEELNIKQEPIKRENESESREYTSTSKDSETEEMSTDDEIERKNESNMNVMSFEKNASTSNSEPKTSKQTIEKLESASTSTSKENLYNIPTELEKEKYIAERLKKNEMGPLSAEYKFYMYKNKKLIDQNFGPRIDGAKFKLGNKIIAFDLDDSIMIGNTLYTGTPGLYQLIFLTKPETYDKNDLKSYHEILELTNAYRAGYTPNGNIKGHRGEKYVNIVKNLIHSKTGLGIKLN